ncbi:MAG: alginate export family protein [Bacteroidota bacterium]
MKKVLLLFWMFATISGLTAQEYLKFSAQIRPRFEIDNKDFKSSTRANTLTAFRTRLGLAFLPVKNISGFIQIQDSRTFGEETSTTANMKNLDLHQAFFKIENLFDLPFDVKLGRFEAIYGSERFIGSVNWHNVGRSFDGGILTYKNEIVNVDLFVAREFEKFLTGDSTDQNIYGLFVDLNLVKSYNLQPFIIMQRMQPINALNRATLGINIKSNLNKLNHEVDFGYQTGTIFSGGREQNISAYTFSFNAEYNFDGELKPTLGAQIDAVSGDSNPIDNNYNAYTSLYGTGHKFFGYMDYFINFPSDTYGLGLIDLIGKFGISPSADLKLNLYFHLFNSMKNYTLLSGTESNSFGTELDLVALYKYNTNVTFEAGGSFFSAGDIFKEKRGKDAATWFYLMAVVNF